MSKRSRKSELIPITDKDMERFHRNARGALEHRALRYMLQEVFEGFQFVLFGTLPIIGLFYWNWQPLQMMVFLLVGAWVGALCDIVKLCLLKKAVMNYANRRYDDWHVWVVADALRKGEKRAPAQHLRAGYQPEAGVVIDFVFGGIGTFLICLTLSAVDSRFPFGLFQEPGFVKALIGFTGYQIILTVWEVLSQRIGKGAGGPVKLAVGLRGVGLFLLMFLMLATVGDEGQNPAGVRYSMLIINGLLILLGLIYISGPVLLARETRWLRGYLKRRSDESPQTQAG